MTLSEISQELRDKASEYEKKAQELQLVADMKQEAEIALLRADGKMKKIKLELGVIRHQIDSLKESGYNIRVESRI
jgi:hypothetical protein